MDLIDVNGVYGILEVAHENIPQIVDSLKLPNYSGVNVTVPYKQLIRPFLDKISPEAETIGTINTIKFKDGKATGYNTDYFVFGTMVEQTGIDVAGKTISLCGAGGVGVAIIRSYNKKSKR
ncbi:shikimate dehydrogenase [Desulfitobacterium sp. AusDCA]